ncbi:MAG: hypothetical protein IJN34_00435 [Clostridia bacterium]|nr:hypothetical protein [Clostridia bacterium]
MKRVVIWLMAVIMLLSATACTDGGNLEGPATENGGVSDNGSMDNNGTNGSNGTDNSGMGNGNGTGNGTENATGNGSNQTVGAQLSSDFKQLLNLDNTLGAAAIAGELLKSDLFDFELTKTEVRPGKLQGFGEKEIKGFKEGVMFTSSKGDVPFIGYVFTLEDHTDSDGFIKTLKENADVEWNQGIKAEEMMAESVGRMVFFSMSPKEFK